MLDTQQTGRIKISELKILLGRNLDAASAAELGELVESIDSDNSGYLDFSEFMALATQKNDLVTKENLEKAFTALDIDKNG